MMSSSIKKTALMAALAASFSGTSIDPSSMIMERPAFAPSRQSRGYKGSVGANQKRTEKKAKRKQASKARRKK